MAISIVTVRLWLFAVALTYVSVLYGNLGMQQRNIDFSTYI